MFNRLRCPPLMVLRSGEPTAKWLIFCKSNSSNTCSTRCLISSSVRLAKQSRAVYHRFWKTVSSSISRSSCGTKPINCLLSSSWMGCPLMQMVPCWGIRLPFKRLSRVDLPTPLPPMMATNCPDSKLKEKLCIPFSLFLKRKLMSLPVK